MMNSYFELLQARNWALYTLKSRDVNVYLNISNITDPSFKWFLEKIHDSGVTKNINNWKVKKESHYFVYSKDHANTVTDIYIHIFQCPQSQNTKYVGLYEKDGRRLCDLCLIIWDVNRPHVTNQGYAPGRCPDSIILETKTLTKIVLSRIYEVPHEKCTFSLDLVFEKEYFHMKLGYKDRFINNMLDVCNWPIEQPWTLEKVCECVRIFTEEYVPGCKMMSYVVDDMYFTGYKTYMIDDKNNSIDVPLPITLPNTTKHFDNKFLSDWLWNTIKDVVFTIPLTNKKPLMVRDSIHDIGYVEDLFPFQGSVDEFGDPYESPVEFYRQWLPSMMKLRGDGFR